MSLMFQTKFLIAILCASCVSAQTENVETFIQNEMQTRKIPGLQVAVVQHGKIVLLKSYGVANIQYSIPVTDQSIFSINSCTKSFTGVGMMKLVEDRKVELSAPVSRYLDGLPAAWQPVTIQQLLTHISGLPDILSISDPTTGKIVGNGSDKAAWEKIQTFPMDFPTGERFSYNQTNYVLLGMIIEKFNGKPFTQVFKEQQFEIAGMRATDFGDSRDVIPNKTQSYRYVSRLDGVALDAQKLTNVYEIFTPFHRTAAGINSTAEDVAHWIIALQQGKILKTKTALKTLWTAGTYNNNQPTQWALGWVTKPRPKHSAVIMTGGGRSAFFVYPEDDLAVVVLTNLSGASPEDFIDELAGYYNPEISASDPVTALRMQLNKRGYEKAIEVYNELKKKDVNFQPTETDLNDWAYRMLNGGGKPKEALEIFKLNVLLYPESSNVYDSVGEAYMKNGDKDKAIENYEKSLKLDPKNTNAVEMLKMLKK